MSHFRSLVQAQLKCLIFVNKLIQFIVGLVLSLGGLWVAFRGFKFQEFLNYLNEANWIYVFFAMLVLVGSVWIRSLRWKHILEPVKLFHIKPLYEATMIGYFGNGVLPFRLGELLRAFAVSRTDQITSSAVFGTIILERLLDLISLSILMIITLFLSPLMEWSIVVLTGLIITSSGGFLFIFWLGKSHSQIHNRVVHWKIFNNIMGQKFLKIINQLATGLTAIQRTHHFAEMLLCTLILWLMYVLSVYTIIQATGILLSWVDACVILVATTLAIAVPSAPGYVGTYHAAAVYILVNVLRISQIEAQAFAIISHAVAYFPLILIGFYYFLRNSIQIKDLKVATVIDEKV